MFSENWNSGVIDTDWWTIAPSPGKVSLQQISPNDWAISSNGDGIHTYLPNARTVGAWSGSFYSQNKYSRAAYTRVTFKAWGDPTKAGPAEGFFDRWPMAPERQRRQLLVGNKESVGMGP